MNISIIIPVYNAERFLEKAVDSALQFSEVKEILLVEDGSPDQSLEVCKKLLIKDKRIKLLQHPDQGNHGAGASRNLGLEKATGDFIAFLDADDYYLINRFDAEKEIFNNEKIFPIIYLFSFTINAQILHQFPQYQVPYIGRYKATTKIFTKKNI